MVAYVRNENGHMLAYEKTQGRGPLVVFLGGFMSDMQGSKAQFFEQWARDAGQAFVRFDYSGHGQSEGEFTLGSVAQWARDANCVIEACTGGDDAGEEVILVGSSMGGWIALYLAKTLGARVKAIIGIAAAPDFTEDSMWAGFNPQQRARLDEDGIIYLPSGYDQDYPISKTLIEESREVLVLRSALRFACPVALVQGSDDQAVTRETALRLFDHIEAEPLSLQFEKGADHSFSSNACLTILQETLERLLYNIRM
jgi:pimeloyl-ACP methyl ester carboxylesterase